MRALQKKQPKIKKFYIHEKKKCMTKGLDNNLINPTLFEKNEI